jgi:hypothetical protein
MGLALTLVVAIQERRERRAMFAPAPCRYCQQWVRWKKDHWTHTDRRQWAEWPNLDYSNPEDHLPLHPALPKALWWPQGGSVT